MSELGEVPKADAPQLSTGAAQPEVSPELEAEAVEQPTTVEGRSMEPQPEPEPAMRRSSYDPALPLGVPEPAMRQACPSATAPPAGSTTGGSVSAADVLAALASVTSSSPAASAGESVLTQEKLEAALATVATGSAADAQGGSGSAVRPRPESAALGLAAAAAIKGIFDPQPEQHLQPEQARAMAFAACETVSLDGDLLTLRLTGVQVQHVEFVEYKPMEVTANLGFTFDKDIGSVLEVQVSPDSPAYACGLRNGVRMVSMGGTTLHTFHKDSARFQIKAALEVADGELVVAFEMMSDAELASAKAAREAKRTASAVAARISTSPTTCPMCRGIGGTGSKCARCDGAGWI